MNAERTSSRESDVPEPASAAYSADAAVTITRRAGSPPDATVNVSEWRRPRFWALVMAALTLIVVVEYKRHQAGQSAARGGSIEPMWPAHFFAFEALDSENRLVKFARYLGRHKILLAFFDGRRGLEGCPQMLTLRETFPRLKAEGAVVLAVTDAIPQENRAAFERIGPFPFPVVSDPTLQVQRRWHCLERVQTNGFAVFFIDRAGRVRVDDRGRPVAEPDLQTALQRILGTPAAHGGD